MPEQVHEPEELEPHCPRCNAKLDTYVRCRECGYELTTDERDAANVAALMAHFERERRRVQPFEIRYWYERPQGVKGTPSHWGVVGYAGSRQEACIIADALQRQRGWRLEVWALDPLHKHLGPRQLYDRFPASD